MIKEDNLIGQSANHHSRNGSKIRLWLLHTEEGPDNRDPYRLHEWMKRNGVSYHYVGGNDIVIDVIDTDRCSWSALDANPYSINWVFSGSKAGQSRQVWLDKFAPDIDNAAKIFVQDAEKYNPLEPTVLAQDYAKIGAGRAGAADHSGVTFGLGIGTHTDVGKNFPWDVFTVAVTKYATGYVTPPVAPVENQINKEAEIAKAWIGKRIDAGELATPERDGRFVRFENAHIYWTAATGARAIPSNIYETYANKGWERGPLGFPINAHSVLEADGKPVGDVQAFEGGRIYRKYGEVGHTIWGLIGAAWIRSGAEKGTYGWPIEDEVDHEGGKVQRFENGYIFWSPDGTIGLKPQDGKDEIWIGDHA